MKNIFSTLLISVLISTSSFSQIGGNAVYKFLNLPVSSKQAAFGGKVYTNLKNDIFQPISNPATLSDEMNNLIGVNYSSYLSSINYGNIAYAKKIKKIGVFYTGISYLNYGQFQYADESGQRNGTFGASETALIIGYAYKIPKSNLKIGANTKYVFSSLENYSSFGVAIDAGLLYHNKNNLIQAALVFRNIGTQITTYQGHKEKLPFEIDLSFSKMFLHAPLKWFITLENLQKLKSAYVNPAHNTEDPNGNVIKERISWSDHIVRHIIIGVEIFPRKKFNLRIGYNFRRTAELSLKTQRFTSGINFGFGLKLRKFEISYGYGKYNLASNAHFISAVINLNEFIK